MEADGFNPTKIYVLSTTKNGKDIFSTSSYDDMRKFLSNPDIRVVFHNGLRFDKVHLERLLGIEIKATIIDTLALSWCLYPLRNSHGLEAWGEDFGIKKPVINDWLNLSQEEYVHRCEEDVKINYILWRLIWNKLNHLYDKNEKEIWRYIDYIDFKMYQAALQEQSGWKVDMKFAEEALVKLLTEQKEKIDKLAEVMPKVPIIKKRAQPKKLTNKKGDLTSLGKSWFEQLAEANLPDSTEEIEYIAGYQEPNPNSTDQKKDWLYSLGWVPQTFKEVKNKKTGQVRSVPQINKDKTKGGGVCDSVKKLYEKEPNLEYIDGLSIITHRISILNGFIRDVDQKGKVKARISGFTNTLRVKHTEVVNLPKVNVAYGEYPRGCLVADEGYELCGADMSSLEDRLKQHYIFPLDPDYVKDMMADDFDPHLDIAFLGNRLTEDQVAYYKWADKNKNESDKSKVKQIKSVRDIFKNVNYAGQYGAGAARIAVTGGIEIQEAKALHKLYWERNWAIKEVAKQQVVKPVDGTLWLFNPVSKFWYYLKDMKDVFSTLVQGTAAYCFDTWLKYILDERPQLTATFHDEGVWMIRKGFRKEAHDLMHRAISYANDELKLNRQLDISVQFGDRYSDIH